VATRRRCNTTAGCEYTRRMSAPSSSEPTRPASLPTQAVWDAEHRLWRVGENDDAGRWHGQQFTYRGNGTLQGEFVYVAGKPDGKFRRYHPDGQTSIEGEHRLGAPVGTHVTYRSAQVNDEAVHTCCLPPNAWKLVTQYPDDGRLLEDYFDDHGRRLLRDGSPYPDAPASVSATARFDFQRPGWVDGRYERSKQHGCFHYWSVEGTLQEVANYKQGQLDGLRERFLDERCVERRMYKAGQPDGCAWEQVARDRFENSAIAAYEGCYERGKHCGKWRYLGAAGQIIATVDLGPVADEVSPDDAVFHTITPQDTLTLDPAREHVRRILYASHHCDDATLHAEVSSVPQLVPSVSEQLLKQLRNETLEPPRYVAKLLHLLMRGARAEHVFRALSAAFLREPQVGLQLLAVALRLAPHELETRAAEVLMLTGLGRIALARERIAALAATNPSEANELAFNLRVTFPTFDYWPNRAEVSGPVSTELPTEVGQGSTPLRIALSKAAARLGEVRRALLAHTDALGEREFELPPDLSHWHIEQPTALDSYTFEISEQDAPGESDVVQVEERLELAGFGLPELMLQARTEWTTLCWLLFAMGAEPPSAVAVGLPAQIDAQPLFGAALTQAFQELYRVTDQLKTSGIRSRSQGVADCTWESCSVSQLGRGLLVQAFAEMRERRAALYFAADGTCRSPWQDDLRVT
jgi:antitoxin component YwqK of YwqJK toxin-antitoxin module